MQKEQIINQNLPKKKLSFLKKLLIFFVVFAGLLVINPGALERLQNYYSTHFSKSHTLPPLGSPIPITLTSEQQTEANQTPEGMIYIPEGDFISGIPTDSDKNGEIESRGKTIWLNPYYIDKYEITNEKFSAFIVANEKWRPGMVSHEFQEGGYLAGFMKQLTPLLGREKYPVTWVSWYAADAYCQAYGKRLPTSAEWEKAGRGTDGRIYPWGDEFDGSRANLCDRTCEIWTRAEEWTDGFPDIAPVGSLLRGASPFGVLDMIGNVAEWVSDWAPADEKSLAEVRNPKGPSTGIWKLVFGRSWASAPIEGYEVYRNNRNTPDKTSPQIGFRCVADVIK